MARSEGRQDAVDGVAVNAVGFLAGYFVCLISVLMAWGCWRAAVMFYRELGREPLFRTGQKR